MMPDFRHLIAIVEAAQGDAPPVTDEQVRAFGHEVEERLGLKTFAIWLTRDQDIKLAQITVREKQKGTGTAAMEELVRFADRHGCRIILTPGLRDDHHGTTSRTRLVRFYKRFGFVENKGRNKDFAITDGMYREPKGKRQVTETDGSPLTFNRHRMRLGQPDSGIDVHLFCYH